MAWWQVVRCTSKTVLRDRAAKCDAGRRKQTACQQHREPVGSSPGHFAIARFGFRRRSFCGRGRKVVARGVGWRLGSRGPGLRDLSIFLTW